MAFFQLLIRTLIISFSLLFWLVLGFSGCRPIEESGSDSLKNKNMKETNVVERGLETLNVPPITISKSGKGNHYIGYSERVRQVWMEARVKTAQIIVDHGVELIHLLAGQPDAEKIVCFTEVYPGFFYSLEGNSGQLFLTTTGGERILWDDGNPNKEFEDLLNAPDLQDTVLYGYPVGREYPHPPKNSDPGRIRVDFFLKLLYGENKKSVAKNLVRISWMPRHTKKKLKVTTRFSVHDALQNISDDLEKLPKKFMKYVTTTAGTFNWRFIGGTERLSAHSYGIAIDINVEFSNYWRWDLKRNPELAYRNKIPMEVVEIFEKHGFVWGGKWYHYDSMHFEYRPELLHKNCVQ